MSFDATLRLKLDEATRHVRRLLALSPLDRHVGGSDADCENCRAAADASTFLADNPRVSSEGREDALTASYRFLRLVSGGVRVSGWVARKLITDLRTYALGIESTLASLTAAFELQCAELERLRTENERLKSPIMAKEVRCACGPADACSSCINAVPVHIVAGVRAKVYEAIDGERDYQSKKWNEDTTSTGGRHSVTEFLVYMHRYVLHAMETVSMKADPQASEEALHDLRKITAMGVACMEQHGAPFRVQPVDERLTGKAEGRSINDACDSHGQRVPDAHVVGHLAGRETRYWQEIGGGWGRRETARQYAGRDAAEQVLKGLGVPGPEGFVEPWVLRGDESGGASPEASRSTAVRVRVEDNTGARIPGVAINYSDNATPVVTNACGETEIDFGSGLAHILTVTLRGYETYDTELNVIDGRVAGLVIKMRPSRPRG